MRGLKIFKSINNTLYCFSKRLISTKSNRLSLKLFNNDQKIPSYNDLLDNFSFKSKTFYNLGHELSEKNVLEHNKTAIEDTNKNALTFSDISLYTNRLAKLLQDQYHIKKGDRVGVLISQSIENVLSHIALFKIGAISVPLFTLFQEEALLHRITDSKLKLIITEPSKYELITKLDSSISYDILIANSFTFSNDIIPAKHNDFKEFIFTSDDDYQVIHTKYTDPCLLIYTSGSTGPPKGALHAHSILDGHLPGIEVQHNLFQYQNQKSDLKFYTPADYAWVGGLLNIALPALYYQIPLVVHKQQGSFQLDIFYQLIKKYQITNMFIPPTILKMMKMNDFMITDDLNSVQCIASGGEPLTASIYQWFQQKFHGKIILNEFYGQTEANLIISNCNFLFPYLNNSMGKVVPGYEVEIIKVSSHKKEYKILKKNGKNIGNLAIKNNHPAILLSYWNNQKATWNKFTYDQQYLLTDDLVTIDKDGYIKFQARNDDLITTSSYRVGPSNIENVILTHNAVSDVAVIGINDPIRTQIIKACIILKKDYKPSEDLKKDIQQLVKDKLSFYEYPRIIEFYQHFPRTITGKIIKKELK